jgi:hypothetical protein
MTQHLTTLTTPTATLPFLLLQAGPLNPTEYQAWGILGTLAFAIFVLCAVLWRLFNRQSQAFEARDKVLMDFVDRHRSEHTRSLEGIASSMTVALKEQGTVLDHSLSKLEEAFNRQQRRLDEFLLVGKVLEKVAAMRKRGDIPLDDTIIEKITTAVISQSRTSSENK